MAPGISEFVAEEEGERTLVPALAQPKIIFVNGPPQSGKDTVGAFIEKNLEGRPVYVTKFAKGLKETAHRLLGFPAAFDAFEDIKDEPQEYLNGRTWRDVYIAVSENLMKPLFGEDIFGRLTVQDIRQNAPADAIVVITDSGFLTEAQVIAQEFGATNCWMWHTVRPGFDFEGDSRSYVQAHEIDPMVRHDSLVAEDVPALQARVRSLLPGIKAEELSITVRLPISDTAGFTYDVRETPVEGFELRDREHATAVMESLAEHQYLNLVLSLYADGELVSNVRRVPASTPQPQPIDGEGV